MRAIDTGDLERLRLWKNANRSAFFFQGEITERGQREWFEGYLARPDDFMFMVNESLGCLGFRLVKGAADVYNVMAAPQASGRGLMRSAMILLCSHILAERCPRIGCLVLKGNPALGWYEKCGYRVAREAENHLELELGSFSPCRYRRQATA